VSGENLELIRRNLELVNEVVRADGTIVDPEHVAPEVWARLAPDFELHERSDLPDGEIYCGREESKAFWRKIQELFSRVRWEPLEYIDLGHAVVVETRLTGVGRGSDVPVEADEVVVFWFRDGLITKLKGFPTREDALAAAKEER
jgi:ketosteroid isomerase-like protein